MFIASHIRDVPATRRLERGAFADLVLLDADPLTDIENARAVHAVVASGRWIGPDQRGALPGC